MGSLNGGHYVAITKNPNNNKWYKFDDNNIINIPESNDNNSQPKPKPLTEQINSSDSYVLFYVLSEYNWLNKIIILIYDYFVIIIINILSRIVDDIFNDIFFNLLYK